jgi:hypothetical protein
LRILAFTPYVFAIATSVHEIWMIRVFGINKLKNRGFYNGIEDSGFLLNNTESTGKLSPVDTLLHLKRLQDLTSEEFVSIEG